MIYELKQKIRHSKFGEELTSWLEKTPFFRFCYRILVYAGLTEQSHLFRQNLQESRTYFANNTEKIQQIVNALADDKSKDVFLKVIHYRQSKFFLMSGTEDDQYFPQGIIRLSENEVFVDCGACTGDSVEKFCEQTHQRYKKIVAFEPDPPCFKKLRSLHIPRCICLEAGVWNQTENLVFYANGLGNSTVISNYNGQPILNNSTKITIPVRSIDETAECEDMTFLKMDVEGAELNALKGAEKTIRKNKPKLAICIYHSDRDIIEIPLWIMSLNMGYKLYVRHHKLYGITETVLYAV